MNNSAGPPAKGVLNQLMEPVTDPQNPAPCSIPAPGSTLNALNCRITTTNAVRLPSSANQCVGRHLSAPVNRASSISTMEPHRINSGRNSTSEVQVETCSASPPLRNCRKSDSNPMTFSSRRPKTGPLPPTTRDAITRTMIELYYRACVVCMDAPAPWCVSYVRDMLCTNAVTDLSIRLNR